MLVLSRRETEKVVFPTLGISIEVLRTRSSTRTCSDVKIGIDVKTLRRLCRDLGERGVHSQNMTWRSSWASEAAS